MLIHNLLLYCYVYLLIKQLFPLYMCICNLVCCPSRALDWLIKYFIETDYIKTHDLFLFKDMSSRSHETVFIYNKEVAVK